MNLHLQLIAETRGSSLSALTIEGIFQCFVLEDGFREIKVKGETRIPSGTYEIVRRRYGKFYTRYRLKYGHEFVCQIADVPGFGDILIHMGNRVEDTAGCLLVARKADFDPRLQLFQVEESELAYLSLYPKFFKAFQVGERVMIIINREVSPFSDHKPIQP